MTKLTPTGNKFSRVFNILRSTTDISVFFEDGKIIVVIVVFLRREGGGVMT